MSSILKALRKLEDDKASRRPDELKIDAEILRSDDSPRFTPTGVIFASLLLLAGGSGATYTYMIRDKAPGIVNQKPREITSQNHSKITAESDIKTEQLTEAVEVVPATQQNTEQLQPHKSTRRAPVVVAPPKSLRPTSAPATQTNPSAPSYPQSSSVKAVPALRVNGIAFQNGGSDSVAIINGTPATSGSEVDGVRIEGIHKDRVSFSFGGEKFDIPLGQSNR